MDPSKAAKPNDPNCRNTGSFERWLDEFRKEARASGVSNATIASALGGMTLDPGIISRDRKQGFFAQTFTAFSGKLISQNRITNGTARLKQHRELLAKAEKDHGVPGPDHRRLLGAGERLRRRHGQSAGAALAGDAGLRLPPARAVPRRADGGAEDHRPRRSAGPRR